MEKIWKRCKELLPYATDMRRCFHRHPELSGFEYETVTQIVRELERHGIEYSVIPCGGVLAKIEGCCKGKAVLLRADCDALPILEDQENAKQQKQCVSEIPGIAHMCGHDAHTGMLLAAARLLQDQKDTLEGTVYCLFERGEEGAGCIYYVLEYLQQKKIKIDSCFAVHVVADLPVGKVAIQGGPTNAAVLNFSIKVTGKGGHASRPDWAVNPIDCFVDIANALRGFASRKVSPYEQLTYTISTVNAGKVTNVIEPELTFGGTCRFFNQETGNQFCAFLKKTVASICELHGCTGSFDELRQLDMPCVCSEELAAFGRKIVGEVIGEEHIVPRGSAMGSESFAVLSQFYPSVSTKIGIRNEDMGCTYPVHTAKFDMDEKALQYGIFLYAVYATAYLREKRVDHMKLFGGSVSELYALMHCDIPKQDSINL